MAIFNHFASRKNFVKPCDFTKKIKELSASNGTQTWVANKDCWLSISAYRASGNDSFIKINGTVVLTGINDYNTHPMLVYVSRGSVIELYASSKSASASMVAYGCL